MVAKYCISIMHSLEKLTRIFGLTIQDFNKNQSIKIISLYEFNNSSSQERLLIDLRAYSDWIK